MDREDEDKLIDSNKRVKEYEWWVLRELPKEIEEGKHRCLFYFGRCVCGKREEQSN
jgi:endonuclease III